MPSAMGAAETASPAPESCESSSESTVLHAEHFHESSLCRALKDLYTAGTTSVLQGGQISAPLMEDPKKIATALSKKLPRYPTVPAVRIGRLAVDNSFKGQSLGGALLADALTRAVHLDIASYAMIVETKDPHSSLLEIFPRHFYPLAPSTRLVLSRRSTP